MSERHVAILDAGPTLRSDFGRNSKNRKMSAPVCERHAHRHGASRAHDHSVNLLSALDRRTLETGRIKATWATARSPSPTRPQTFVRRADYWPVSPVHTSWNCTAPFTY